MLLRLQGVGKGFGARRLFDGVDLVVRAGDRIGLVGPNGVGKTTLLRIAAGLEAADAGDVVTPRDARVALLRQEIDPAAGRSVREEAATAFAELDAQENELRALEARMASEGGGEVDPGVAERYDALRHRFELGGGFEREARVERVLEGLGFDAARRERPLATFSGGWLMRVELAKLLLADPDVLLLDEPTNHLDLPSIQWFEETLQAFRGAVVTISHDRTFLRRHVARVAELLPSGWSVYEGGYDAYLEQREERRLLLEAALRNQDRKRAEAERFIERFRYKASKARQVQSRIKALEKMERIEAAPGPARRMRLRLAQPARAGEVVLRLDGVHKAYGETRVYEGIDLQVQRGERVALVGPNGAGKSTLLRLLAGVLAPDRGERTVGHNVQIAFYAQHQLEALDAGRTVLEELASVAHTDDHPRLRGHLGAFLFSGDDVEKRVSVLSGGEKARIALAKMLLHPANVLVLDEPTNHLDVEACEVLEGALAGYGGTLLFISHDRSFINALATRVLEVRPGSLRDFLGDYDAYRARLAAEASAPAAEAGAPAPGSGSAAPRERARAASTEGRPAPARSAGAADPALAREARRADRERRKARERSGRKLARLEEEILRHETLLEELGHRLGDPDLWKDPERARGLDEERAELRRVIDAHYREWERLAAELEALSDAS